MIPEFHYTVGWRPAGAHPGSHRSGQRGSGDEFAGYVPFLSHPDPRHLDVRASLNDPFGQLMVRSFRQRSSVPVFVVADLSASMDFRGTGAKQENLARFAAAACHSAYRSGDPFGFIGCDETLHADLLLPLRFHKGAAPELYHRLSRLSLRGRSATALQLAAQYLGRQRALVFLVSDFHFPLAWVDTLLGSLVRHDVVPLVLWDSAEYERLPAFGLTYVEDPETGECRRLFMRPSLREKFREGFEQRREELIQLCTRRGREPFFLIDAFDADALTRYFYQ